MVEDDTEIRNAIKDVLEDEGYLAVLTNDGQQALNYLNTAKELPAFILLDLMMPVMDGIEFRIHQMQNEKFAKIPTAILSADGQVLKKAKEMGIEHTLKKPVELDSLLDLIAKLT